MTDGDTKLDALIQTMDVATTGDPGIVLLWADDATLHECLGVAGSPVAPGADPAESSERLKHLFRQLVVDQNAEAPVMDNGDRSTAVFHHLSDIQYVAFMAALLATPTIGIWQTALNEANLSAGTYYVILGAGVGRAHAERQLLTPFL